MSAKSLTTLALCHLILVLASPPALGADVHNAFLPGHVEAPEGKLSLYADYGSIRTDGSVPVYLVNRSVETFDFETLDRFLKLEYRSAPGDWVRAQAHYPRGCVIYRSTLRPGHFLLLGGYQPINGTPRDIRYRLHAPGVGLASNTGHGVVSEAMVTFAAHDDLSLASAMFEEVLRIARGEMLVAVDWQLTSYLRALAIAELAADRFDRDDSRQALLRIRDESGPALREHAAWALRRLDRKD